MTNTWRKVPFALTIKIAKFSLTLFFLGIFYDTGILTSPKYASFALDFTFLLGFVVIKIMIKSSFQPRVSVVPLHPASPNHPLRSHQLHCLHVIFIICTSMIMIIRSITDMSSSLFINHVKTSHPPGETLL